MSKQILMLLILVGFYSCRPSQDEIIEETRDPLPSWSGESRERIITYVQGVTNSKSQSFVPAGDRIATFDNDGTLWAEQPVYFQLFFVMDRIKDLEDANPEWKKSELFNAAITGDLHGVMKHGEEGLLKLVEATHGNVTASDFEAAVSKWLAEARHPKTNLPFTSMVYQPMLELIDYLKANDFTVFIVSGGGVSFMRPWTESVYGIPKHQVIGSRMISEFQNIERPIIYRKPQLGFVDDKAGKPVAIYEQIGRKPLIAVGNSDGDLQMLQWSASNDFESLQVYIHHTDSVREWAYDRESHIGRFDKGLDQAQQDGWLVVSMKEDWKKVFSFD